MPVALCSYLGSLEPVNPLLNIRTLS